MLIGAEDQPNVMIAVFVNEPALEVEYVDEEKVKSTLEKFLKNLFNSRSEESDITSIKRYNRHKFGLGTTPRHS